MHNTLPSSLQLPAGTQAVIFDMDGVLIDSWASTMRFFTLIREAVGLGPLSSEEQEMCFIQTVEQSLRRFIPSELYPEAEKAWKQMDWNMLIPLIKPQPGIAGFLAELKKLGLRSAVNTNGGSEQRGILDQLGLLDYFDMVVTVQEVSEGKPSPEGIHRILNTFDLRVDQVVFIGDSSVDMETARRAGVPFWAYGNSSLEADRHVSSYL